MLKKILLLLLMGLLGLQLFTLVKTQAADDPTIFDDSAVFDDSDILLNTTGDTTTPIHSVNSTNLKIETTLHERITQIHREHKKLQEDLLILYWEIQRNNQKCETN